VTTLEVIASYIDSWVRPFVRCKNRLASTSIQKGAILPDIPKYSIVIPLHNEEQNIRELYTSLAMVLGARKDESFELVLVDDGSSDRTFLLLQEIATVDSRVTVVRLRRNFGQTAGLAAGFDHARGEYVIAMDGDLQHDPADIPLFLEKITEGYDIISGWRKNRVDNFWLRRIPSRCANWLMAKLSGVDIHDFGTTFAKFWSRFRSTENSTVSSRHWPPGMVQPSVKFQSRTSIASVAHRITASREHFGCFLTC
jgi:glycosyltransferase involved in cell wall biosynthesis